MISKRMVIAMIACLLLAAALLAPQSPVSLRAEQQLSSTWIRCGGPLGGLGYDIRMHPLDPDTMFVTDSYAGVFKSDDGGQSWYPSSNHIEVHGGDSGDALKAFCLTIDPVNPGTIWVGLQNYGEIYKSTDGGRNWTLKVNGIGDGYLDGLSFRGFTVDPQHPDTVYAAGEINSLRWNGAVLNGRQFDRTMGMVYKTENGGDSWTAIWTGANLARYVWIDPDDTQVLYVSTGITDREAANTDTTTNDPGGVGILKSYDGGAHWEDRNNGLTNLYIGTLFMHPYDPDILLAGADSGVWPAGAGVFRTTDGGNSWVKVLSAGANSVEFAMSDSLIAYAGGAGAVYMSDDGGETFRQMTSGPPTDGWGSPGVQSGFPIDFQVHPFDASRIFANSYGGGNFVSADSGHTWAVASEGYTGALVKDVAVAGDDPGRVYAAARSGMFVSYNFGEEWHGRGFAPALPGLEWRAVAINPLNSSHMLAAFDLYNVILETRDGAQTWQTTTGTVPEPHIWRCFAFAPSDTQTIYAGSGAGTVENAGMGIYKSTNGGLIWSAANDATSDTANVAELAVQADNDSVVYAACSNMGLLKTMNGGATWAASAFDTLANPRALSVAIDPADANHVLAGMDDAGLYQSFNGGANFSSVPVGLPAEADVMDIAYCPVDANLIYVADRRSGVYRSTDGGGSWIKVNDGLRMRAVNALAFSGDGQVIYAGTEGEGVFRLDGAGPVTAVGDSPPNPRRVGLQVYPNPFNPGATVAYKARAGEHVRVAIYDVAGRLVRVLHDGGVVSTGRHEVVWDGRNNRGQSVASGVYLCRAEVGENLETKKMVLVK